MNFSSRNRRAAVLGAVALAAIFAVRFAVIPWIESWSHARGRIGAAGGQLEVLQRRVHRVLGQRQRLERLYGLGANKPLQDLEAARVSLYKAVQNVLKTSGLKPTEYQPQPPRPLRDMKGVEIVPLQVRGKCQLPQLAKCLAGLRQAETLVFVDRLLTTNDEKKPGQLEVTLTLATLADRQKGRS